MCKLRGGAGQEVVNSDDCVIRSPVVLAKLCTEGLWDEVMLCYINNVMNDCLRLYSLLHREYLFQ